MPKASFSDLNLDPRILQALLKNGFNRPTQVQKLALPPAIESRDLLIRGKTGCGKTLAFVLPTIQKLLSSPSTRSGGPRAVILVPTRELVDQTMSVVSQLTQFCNDTLRAFALSGPMKKRFKAEKPRLRESPDILICTPARLAKHLRQNNTNLDRVSIIVIDEADLMETYHFSNDIQLIAQRISPTNRPQFILSSATLNPNTTHLQNALLIHCAVVVQTQQDGFDESKLVEYQFRVKDFNDKFLVMYTLLKLNIINGKALIFCHSTNLSYRLKLFLEKFLIPSAVLNISMPFNSRQSVIDKFNRGIVKYLITTDEIREHDKATDNLIDTFMSEDTKQETDEKADSDVEMEEVAADDDANMGAENDYDFDDEEADLLKQLNPETGVPSSGVKRGVDFREVSAVINFSAPYFVKTYIHRAGRTARCGNSGVCITLVTPREMEKFSRVLSGRVHPRTNECMIKELPLRMEDMEGFRYRCESARCALTAQFVRKARLNEIRMEILNSQRLTSHFSERRREFELLRHDKMLAPADMVKPNMSQIPSYLLTESLKPPKGQGSVSAVQMYRRMYHRLPGPIQHKIYKNKMKAKRRGTPGLTRQMKRRRGANLKLDEKIKQGIDMDDNTTAVDHRPFRERVRSWRAPLRKKLVREGKRKPSLGSVSKAQYKMIKKRQKMKKMSRRKKK